MAQQVGLGRGLTCPFISALLITRDYERRGLEDG
jgi:hypothetical protein